MKQNVNLLPSTGSLAGEPPQAALLAVSWLGLAVVLAVLQWWWQGTADEVAAQAQQLRTQVAAAENELNAMTAARMAGSDDTLEAELNQVMHELDMRETILGLVAGGHAGDTAGYSSQIRALARKVTEGVWLTRVAVTTPAARTTLEGKALSPEFVPLYLRSLSGEAPLAGQRFDRLEINRPDEPGEPVAFVLNRKPVEKTP